MGGGASIQTPLYALNSEQVASFVASRGEAYVEYAKVFKIFIGITGSLLATIKEEEIEDVLKDIGITRQIHIRQLSAMLMTHHRSERSLATSSSAPVIGPTHLTTDVPALYVHEGATDAAKGTTATTPTMENGSSDDGAFEDDTDVGGQAAVHLAGAAGNNALFVNGVYELTSEMSCGGVTVYRKIGYADLWLEYCADTGE